MESDISARALTAFFERSGMVERVCDSRESHVGIELGSAVSWISSSFRVACNEVMGVVSDSESFTLRESSSSDVSDSSEMASLS